MVKVFRSIHLWLSVPFGVIVTLVCFSGAMMVFEQEITRLARCEVYYVPSAEDAPLPMNQLIEAIEAEYRQPVAVSGITVFNDSRRTYQVSLTDPRRETVFVDQYSGRITGKYERPAFFATMVKLHRRLLDSPAPQGGGILTGKLLVGISTGVFVVVLLTGIVLWLPRARKSFRRSLTVSASHGWKSFWIGLHVAGGMYALLLVLAMALTGLTWSFEWYRNATYALFGVERTSGGSPQGAGVSAQSESEGSQPDYSFWQQAFETLKSEYPAAPQITVSNGSAQVMLGNMGNERAADRYEFNPQNGELNLTAAYSDSSRTSKLRGWIRSVHTGTFGGVFTKILWFLGALLGASLPLTGYYIWIIRLRNKRVEHL